MLFYFIVYGHKNFLPTASPTSSPLLPTYHFTPTLSGSDEWGVMSDEWGVMSDEWGVMSRE